MKWVGGFLLALAGIPASAWALMLLFGVLHHEVSAHIPAIGYMPSLAISATFGLYRGIGAAFRGAATEVVK